GTDYTPARLYHRETGRFTTRDPHPTPLNKYQAYAANPIENTDPTGNLSIRFRTKLTKQHERNVRLKDAAIKASSERMRGAENALAQEMESGTNKMRGFLKARRAMKTLYSSVAPMPESAVEFAFGLRQTGMSATNALNSVMRQAIPVNGCQAFVASCLKTFGEGELSIPAERVDFSPKDTAWPVVARGTIDQIGGFLKGRKARKGRIYLLEMHIKSKEGREWGNGIIVFIGSRNGEPIIKQNDNGRYQDFNFGKDYTGMAVRYWLVDTGVDKLANSKLDQILIESLAEKAEIDPFSS
ncbi:hypothetical protein, partial [Streptomyces sp. NRRL F-2664]|uniref:hypothetical protein n=1 Tax=Streptomyces sp. NRRL F-2664 TaxID=1463842 RepID=UPI00131B6440